ncbi:MAG TPA: hypothetical protein PLI98_05725, partial [Candidatus Hydrogenedentes bacterium]|nr:hypothetical protein [Candidatus Hydrogenedentota bacterium]
MSRRHATGRRGTGGAMALCCLALLCACASGAADQASERAALRAAVGDLAETFGDAYPRGGAFLAALDAL